MNLKGFRTKISAAFAALPTAAATIVAQIDPQLVLQTIADYPVPLACYQGLTYLATHYYRNEATVDAEPAKATETVVEDDERLLPPQNDLELELAEEIQEGINDV